MATSLAFEEALAKFKNNLKPEDKAHFSTTTLDDLKASIVMMQKQQASEKKLKNMTRLSKFLEAMQTYAKILDLFVNVNDFVAFVWGPMKYLLEVANTFAEAFHVLMDAYERIAEHLPVLAEYQSLFATNKDMQEALGLVFQDIFEFHLRALKYFRGSVWKQLFHATWKTFNTKFEGILDNLRHHRALVENRAVLLNVQESQIARAEWAKEIKEAKTARDAWAAKIQEDEKAEMHRRRTFLTSWLSAADVWSDQERGALARQDHPDSGKWILRRDKFRAWVDPNTTTSLLLWITGMPGAGKTVLASLIIEEVIDLKSPAVFYFYCRHLDPLRDNYVAMARSFLLQMIRGDDPDELVITYLYDKAVASGEVVLNTRTFAKELLDICLKAIGKSYIIVDGLDECSKVEQQHIATWLREYIDSSASEPGPSRCLFLSQDDTPTRSLLSKLPQLRISPEDNQADIETYCVSEAKTIQKRFGITDFVTKNIADLSSRGAKGMFLFAKLVLQNLLDQKNRANLMDELKVGVFPPDLKAAYARILNRLLNQRPSKDVEEINRLFQWIVCAVRPLKWREIQVAVSIDSTSGTVDIEHHRLIDDAKHFCGSLVEECPNGQIVFVHATARRYLVEQKHVDTQRANMKLAILCLEYMCFDLFNEIADIEDSDPAIQDGSYAFSDYAVISWTKHFELALDEAADASLLAEVEQTLDSFFELRWKPPRTPSRPLKHTHKSVSHLQSQTLQSRMLQSMASMHALLSGEVFDFTSVSTVDVFQTLFRIRDRLEISSNDLILAPKLKRLYGPNLFKCPRLYCKWFHEGFDTQTKRKQHLDRHERSHFCPYAVCFSAEFGYPSKAELEDHIQDYHKPLPTDDNFPSLNYGSQRSRTAQKPDGQHICSICGTSFGKKFNLTAHEKKHKSEPAFSCYICGKKFDRDQERLRHMTGVHGGEKKFVCSGSYEGAKYGCGKTFVRSDALMRHLKSKAGQACCQSQTNGPVFGASEVDDAHIGQLSNADETAEEIRNISFDDFFYKAVFGVEPAPEYE